MYGARGDHKARVDGAPDDTPQGVPCSLVKPIQKIVKTMLHHVSRRAVVEPKNADCLD